jgi:hypothetical protein
MLREEEADYDTNLQNPMNKPIESLLIPKNDNNKNDVNYYQMSKIERLQSNIFKMTDNNNCSRNDINKRQTFASNYPLSSLSSIP